MRKKVKNMADINSDQSGVIHHLLMISLVVVIVAAIGFGGYRVYKSHQVKAKAYAWTYALMDRTSSGDVTMAYCRVGSGLDYYIMNHSSFIAVVNGSTRVNAHSNSSIAYSSGTITVGAGGLTGTVYVGGTYSRVPYC